MEIAEKALEILPSPRYWKKGNEAGGNFDERHCLFGALLVAADYHALVYNNDAEFQGAVNAAAAIISEQFPDRRNKRRPPATSSNVIADFNDHKNTRYTDVRLVLEKLAAREEPQQ